MRIKFATQILSHTTASAIRTICYDDNDNLFNKKDIANFALPTAYFCDMFNKCFDCLNKFPIHDKIGSIDASSKYRLRSVSLIMCTNHHVYKLCLCLRAGSFKVIL